jgi:hypothetical protein
MVKNSYWNEETNDYKAWLKKEYNSYSKSKFHGFRSSPSLAPQPKPFVVTAPLHPSGASKPRTKLLVQRKELFFSTILDERQFRNAMQETHQINFVGETFSDVLSFAYELLDELGKKPKHDLRIGPLTYEHRLDSLLSLLASKHFPKKELVSPTEHLHELAYNCKQATSSQDIHSTVRTAFDTGAPLYFSYTSVRTNAAGKKETQTRFRRVNVKSISDTWFSATSDRGQRRYSFGKIQSAVVEGVKPLTVLPEVVLLIGLRKGIFGRKEAGFTLSSQTSMKELL